MRIYSERVLSFLIFFSSLKKCGDNLGGNEPNPQNKKKASGIPKSFIIPLSQEDASKQKDSICIDGVYGILQPQKY